MGRAESKEIPLISEAKVVKSGVVRVMELQEQGWTYVKPERGRKLRSNSTTPPRNIKKHSAWRRSVRSAKPSINQAK